MRLRKIAPKREKREEGITPVIGTIILVAGTILIASVSLGYVLGVTQTQTKHFTITSLNLYSGTASARGGGAPCSGTAILLVTFNNPGPSVSVSAATLLAGDGSSILGIVSAGRSCNYGGSLSGGGFTTITFFLTQPISSGALYSYEIELANGQSVTGSTVAQ